MSLILLAVGVWFLVGLLCMTTSIFLGWKRGEDLTLGEFCEMLILIPLGLLPVFYGLIEVLKDKVENISVNKDKVILGGSKSAKMYKALTDDKWPS